MKVFTIFTARITYALIMNQSKLLVIYYTQTGQLTDILDSMLEPLRSDSQVSIEMKALKPQPDFPFPWSMDQFFQAFPESVKGIPCLLEPIAYQYPHYDAIIFAYQPWFLSPSIPVHAFFKTEPFAKILKDTPVITVIGCRNMWAMAQEQVKKYLHKADARLVGNIVLRDRAQNLISVVSIVRWLIKNKKKGTRIIPDAGVSPHDIREASRFGKLINEMLNNRNFAQLQTQILELKGVEIDPGILSVEKKGKRIFEVWASLILRKGAYGSPNRVFLLRAFKYYLYVVIFLLSPFVTVLHWLLRPVMRTRVRKQVAYYQGIELKK